MKPVLHVITTICRGGAENQLITLIKEQTNSGRKVSLIYLKGEPELLKLLNQMGVEVHSEYAGLSPLAQVIKIRRFLRDKELLIHGHLPRAELICSLAKGNNPLFLTRHNAEKFFPSAPKLISSMMSRFVIRKSRTVIAISQSVSKFLVEQKELPPNVGSEVVYYGFNSHNEVTNIEKLRESLGIPIGAKIVGTVARLTQQKDIPTLLRAYSQLNLDCNLRLLIVGDGPLRDELKILADELGIQEQVIWAGRTSDVFAHLCLMNVFVLTSTYEGFGLVLLEALEARLPIVASNTSAIPEVLGQEYPGLVTPKNYLEFARKISEFLEISGEEMANLQEIGRNRVAYFSADKMRQKIDEIYGD